MYYSQTCVERSLLGNGKMTVTYWVTAAEHIRQLKILGSQCDGCNIWVTAIYRAVLYRFDSHCSLKNTVYVAGAG